MFDSIQEFVESNIIERLPKNIQRSYYTVVWTNNGNLNLHELKKFIRMSDKYPNYLARRLSVMTQGELEYYIAALGINVKYH